MILLLFLIILAFQNGVGQCLAVDGEWVTAQDIAERIPRYAELDPTLRLMRTPFPGARRVVGPSALPVVEGNRTEVVSPFCLERQLHFLSREVFAEALRRTLAASSEAETAFELVDYDRSMLPSGKLEFLVQNLPPPIFGSTEDPVLWRGKLFYGEGRSVPVWVRVSMWVEGEVCLLTRDVARGEGLKIEDCKIGKKRYPPFAPPPLRDPSSLQRTTAVRKLKAEEPIYQTLLVRKPDVAAGELVEIKVLQRGMQLRFQAKAASSGRRGDSVAVTNPANGKRIEGQVVGRGSVEVRLK